MTEEVRIETVESSGSRIYVIDGKGYPSVTSILGEAYPKGFLSGWYARMAAKRAWEDYGTLRTHKAAGEQQEALRWLSGAAEDHRDAAADRGSRIHMLVEDWWREGPDENGPEWERLGSATEEEEDVAEHIVAFLQTPGVEVVDMERPVWADEPFGYAGRVDLWVNASDKVLGLGDDETPKLRIADIKTGKSVGPQAAAQLTAYAHAGHLQTRDGRLAENYMCEGVGIILHAGPRGCRVRAVDVDDENLWRAFQACATLYGLVRNEWADEEPVSKVKRTFKTSS